MKFWKYQGAGNDFVMLDQREYTWIHRNDTEKIARICNRRFGVGADGLILLQPHANLDFEMVYFNADGRESSMCGNGGRCIAAFAQHLGVVQGQCHFWAIDGAHEAIITPKSADASWVELKMMDVKTVEKQDNAFVLNTGSPHYVRFVDSLENLDMVAQGRAVRYSELWRTNGINVNLVSPSPSGKGYDIRTYERGVEDETLACGTGVTAAAIASFIQNGSALGEYEIPLKALGGDLAVRFEAKAGGEFSNVWLCGPAERVFEGKIETIL
ncbi:MAG: diaminopimelate epimerase [Saprospiraceae bacterium]|nr:diaminopimelate epimerase [Saprospiraceae bacterium]